MDNHLQNQKSINKKNEVKTTDVYIFIHLFSEILINKNKDDLIDPVDKNDKLKEEEKNKTNLGFHS